MDPNASAPEGTSLLSNSSGSRLSLPTSYSLDSDDIDNSMKNYALEVDNDKDNGGGGGYGNEGFGNGDDGLETLEKASGGDYTDGPSFDSLVFSRQKSVSVRPVAKVSADDDEDEDENYVVEGENLGGLEVEEDERGVALEIAGVEGSVDNWGIGGAVLEKEEVLEQKGLSLNGNLGESAIGSGIVDAHKGGSEFLVAGGEDKVFEYAKWIEDSVVELKGEEAVEELKSEGLDGEESVVVTETVEAAVATKESTILGVGLDQAESVNIKPVDDKLLELDGVKFTTGGDSIVENLNINLSKAGAIVVGDVEEIEDADIRGLEVPVRGGITLDNGFDQISGDAKERVDLKSLVVGTESDQIVEPVNKFGIDAAGVGIYGEKNSVAEVEKIENLDINTAIVEEEKQDDIKTYVEEGGTESLVNAEKQPEGENEPKLVPKVTQPDSDEVERPLDNGVIGADARVDEARVSGKINSIQSVELSSILSREIKLESQDEENQHSDMEDQVEGSFTDGENDGMIFGSSEAAKQFLEELERGSGAESSHDHSQRLDGQIVTDSDEEVDTDEEGDGKELFDSAALAALLKAATGAGSDDGSITITSQDGSRLFSVERPAGLGSSLRSVKPAPRQNRSNLFAPDLTVGDNSENNLSEEDKKKLENLQQIRVKFLRLVQRLGVSPEESIAAQVLYRMALIAGRQTGQLFSLEAAKRTSVLLEAEGKDDLSFSLNILVLGKSGVGKSATINSIFGEDKTLIDAFGPATTDVKEIVGTVDGVKIRVFDTPGLKSSALEQGINRRILSSVKKFTKKCPPDIVLYVDRLDAQTRDLNDLPLLRSIASSLGSSIWRSTIITLTHAASAPPDGPSGTPLRYDAYVAQRSHVVQQTIGQAVGDLRLMNPSLMMTPVSLVENHPSCRKNREGQKILPNGLSWRPQLLLLCYSMKILSEVNNLSKPQELFDHRKLFGFRTRSPPLPYLLSWLLQSRTHPKLSADQGGDNGDSDIDLDDLSDSEQAEEEEDEYDQLPPFKPLRKYQIAKLSKEQKKAYFEEYEYRVKLLQKKQWRDELKRLRDMKNKGKVNAEDYGFDGEDDGENGTPAAVPVVLPDTALPPSFDGDNPSYRYRFLEPISQFVTRPVLDTHGWDHDCGYDGVNLEQSLAIASRFPAAVTVQITKDKKEFNLHVDSAVSAKHGENGSSMAGFDIQTIGKQLAYIVRGETKFKNLKKNKTTAGVSLTFLGENVSTGVKIEDQIALGKRLVLIGSTGTVRSQGDSAYGANLEVRLREADYPIGQDQSSLGLSLVKWKGDTALGANFQSQISIGRSYKVAVRAGLNNKLSGQITVRTSSSDQLQLALVGILPIVRAIYKIIWPGASENYSIY